MIDLGGIKVLLVDGSMLMRRYLGKMLDEIGFKDIEDVKNVNSALEKLREKRFDLIVSDWMIPGKSGLDFLKIVRRDEKLKDISFMMVTAEGISSNIESAVAAGVDAYITKPFTANVLEKNIKELFNKQHSI